MDYLIKKSDGSVVETHQNAVKIKLPEMTGSDAIHVGDKRPLDLGDYLLIKASEVGPPIIPANKKSGPDEVTVNVQAKTVVVRKTLVDKTAEDIDAEINAARIQGYGPLNDQLDAHYWDIVNGTTNWPDHITAVKAANPKP